MAEETPQEQFDKYKKELGKQYMDGLISDKEYDQMLKDKEEELGLNKPAIADLDEGPECPSCGALINEMDTECAICGIALEPAVKEAEPIPAEELDIEGPDMPGRTCPECGAEVSEADSICNMCGTVLSDEPVIDELEAKPEPELVEDAPLDDEQTCPSCGAFVDAGATECIICDTPLGTASEAPEEEVPEMPEEPAPEPSIEESEGELACAGCGAVLDAGATECFICGQEVGGAPEEAPAEPEPAEEPPEDPLPEPVEKPTEEPVEEPEPMPEEPPIEEQEDEELLEIQEEVPEAEVVEEIVLMEGEILCPSCSSVIPEESEKCPECWTDFSLYVRCPACNLLTPSGEDSCRECFAPLDLPEPEPEEETPYIPGEMDLSPMDVELPDEEIEISEELQEEMTYLESEEEQGKECLVCGAIFGPEDQVCPICQMEFGTEIEEPDRIDYDSWETMEVAVAPAHYICPNCGEDVTGLDATDREISEGRWFYRGIIAIFTGIFFTSFSIWARGISAENASLGLNPPPTDVLLNVIGWIAVLIGFVFWFFSWKLHEEKLECQQCGIEINPDMANCINCGVDLTGGEQFVDEDYPEEYYEEEPVVEDIEEYYEEPLGVSEEYQEEVYEEELEVPAEPEMPADVPAEPQEVGEELPTEHEEHKQCPGCGIFVDLDDAVCPVCDTVFDAVDEPVEEPAIEPEQEEPFQETTEELAIEPEPTIADEDIEIPSEEDELAALGPVEAEEEATLPEDGVEHIECPSCGADVEKGSAACPVCEYPLI